MSEGLPPEPSVLVQGGPLDGHEVKLSPGTTLIIGSGRLAHLRLDHPDIELAHVKVSWDNLGISMVDNGSRRGTWVNGEPVETTALMDGDVIEFLQPGAKPAAAAPPPKIRLRIPKGVLPDELPPVPPSESVLSAEGGAKLPKAAKPKPTKPKAVRARRTDLMSRLPDPRTLAIAAGALALVGGGAWLGLRLFFTAPKIDAIQPGRAEPGQTITISGHRFTSDAADNLVFFGPRQVPASAVNGDKLQVRVPPLGASGTVSVVVQNRRGRSGAVPFDYVATLKAVATDPPGALPGDEVALTGEGFSANVKVSVAGAAASVVEAGGGAVRFRMPDLQARSGSRLDVIATVDGRSTAPVPLYFGRLPIVSGFEPAQARAGELVRVRGLGFAPAAGENAVTFDGVAALVVSASASELVVVAPPPLRAQAETLAQVVVRSSGRSSTDGATFPLLRLVEGTWVPRFVAGAIAEAPGRAVVGTEIAPAILLASADGRRSVAERALQLAAALNAAVDKARVGQKVAFEPREEPSPGIALAGSPDLLLRVTAEDAAAYGTPPGLPPRAAPPVLAQLARHWAAVLNDTVAIGTSGAAPTALAESAPDGARAFAQLRAALPYQYASGVASSRVATLPPDLRRRLRDAALRVP